MRLIDFYPTQGTFRPGAPIRFRAEIESDDPRWVTCRLTIVHLATPVDSWSVAVQLNAGLNSVDLDWSAPSIAPIGYGATVNVLTDGERIVRASTAFDVLAAWTQFPRYGFLSDFSSKRDDVEATLDALTRFHLNGVQFYDWQYRHDQLLSPVDDYVDPLGRPMSLATMRALIDAAHRRNMAALPYLAIYAASDAFWKQHLDWALYDARHEPLAFGEDFLGLMDPSPDGDWATHLLAECDRALAGLPFDGLHIDQYGDPKSGWNAVGTAVDLPSAFVDFIDTAKARHPTKTILFNAVGNWPIEALARSSYDFNYIEVWPPLTRYADLRDIVRNARQLSGGKPVTIALYLPADRPANIRLADALIFSSGGARIELGERARLLADPYFPKHQMLSDDLHTTLRRYYDFVVRYGDLIGPSADDLDDALLQAPSDVWAIARRSASWLTICMINGAGLSGAGWDQAHAAPAPLLNVPIEVSLSDRPVHAYWASPDQAGLDLEPIDFSVEARSVHITIPELNYWAIVTFQLAQME